jgi:hypothetical protein
MYYGNRHFNLFNQDLLFESRTTDYYNGQEKNEIYGLFYLKAFGYSVTVAAGT